MGPEVHINSKINTETHLHCIIQTEEEKKKSISQYFSNTTVRVQKYLLSDRLMRYKRHRDARKIFLKHQNSIKRKKIVFWCLQFCMSLKRWRDYPIGPADVCSRTGKIPGGFKRSFSSQVVTSKSIIVVQCFWPFDYEEDNILNIHLPTSL